MGYHADTCAAIISNICQEQTITNDEDVSRTLHVQSLLEFNAEPKRILRSLDYLFLSKIK